MDLIRSHAVLVGNEGATVQLTLGFYKRAIVNTTILGVLLLVFDEPASAWLTFGLAGSYLIVARLLASSPDQRWLLSAVATGMSFVNHIGVHILLGGYANSGAWFVFGVVVTALVPFWARRSTLLITGGVYGATAIVLAFFEASLRAGRPPVDPLLPTILFPFRMITALVLLAGLIYLAVRQIEDEQDRSEHLITHMVPASVAGRLREQKDDTLADHIDDCTVVFVDLVGFTAHSREVSPHVLLDELDEVFTDFDELATRHGLQTIKTIGDGYMAVAGAPLPQADHVGRACGFALDLLNSEKLGLGVRIGINAGPVIAGVIGKNRLTYDLWGKTVNLASRLESTGEPDQIRVSATVKERVDDRYKFEFEGTSQMKGIGTVTVFRLTGRSHPEP